MDEHPEVQNPIDPSSPLSLDKWHRFDRFKTSNILRLFKKLMVLPSSLFCLQASLQSGLGGFFSSSSLLNQEAPHMLGKVTRGGNRNIKLWIEGARELAGQVTRKEQRRMWSALTPPARVLQRCLGEAHPPSLPSVPHRVNNPLPFSPLSLLIIWKNCRHLSLILPPPRHTIGTSLLESRTFAQEQNAVVAWLASSRILTRIRQRSCLSSLYLDLPIAGQVSMLALWDPRKDHTLHLTSVPLVCCILGFLSFF